MAEEVKTSDPMALSRQRVQEARQDQSGRVYRVFSDGIWDMCHIGHANMLKQVKQSLDPLGAKVHLIVGVCNDEDTLKFKGKTVLSHEVRCETLKHFKWVDQVVPNSPWIITQEFLDQHQIDFVAHDAIPYVSADSEDVYAFVKSQGKFLETQRTDGISTSDIINTIVTQYDDFVERNLDRGYTKEQLNVGKTWEARKAFHDKEKQLKERVNVTKNELKESRTAVELFVKQFNLRHGLVQDDNSNRRYFTPVKYFEHLQSSLPESGEGIVHHAWELSKTLFKTYLSVVSYFNPLSYCRSSKKKTS